MTDETLHISDLEYGESYTNCVIINDDTPLRLDTLQFEKCTFSTINFDESEILDCTFIHCDFSNTDWSGSIIYRSLFENCRLVGIDLAQTQLKDTRYTNCHALYANFSEAKMTNTAFQTTQLTESYFQNLLSIKKTTFVACQLDGADFGGTSLKGVDFSKSNFESLVFSPELMAGCTLNQEQAAIFMINLGVKIK
ncbi:pentapeptide repeat-containing protein [Weissella viridescens]|uniref:pentapeptide repeat-containing protein n=1 Tax=Weissella viridescens TaxID=1629 RepID=UPI001D07E31F|nr:pentapeptide repeat-containing protein [Weissella viridescens]MCB6839488.1 pentapeptide repeat-containing protein [Weissella viridescens]MCB6846219.1 pentapeptide repeat-containing protein [Weissella viridescens]